MKQGAVLSAGLAIGATTALLIRRSRSQREVRRLLHSNASLVTNVQQRQLVGCLAALGHGHLFSHWAPKGINDAAKRRLLMTTAAAIREAVLQPDVEATRLEALQAPIAERRPRELEAHGDIRQDPYYWLRSDDRTDPEVIEQLKAETAHAKAALADTEELQEELYRELRGRIQEADQSVPQRYEGYYYYSRTVEGGQYRVRCRRRLPPGTPPPSETDEMDVGIEEEVLLDENAEAEKHSFYMVRGFAVSPDHARLAYTVDTVGGEKFTLHVIEIASQKELLKKPIEDTAGSVVWANDNTSLFYVTKDALDRPYKVWRYSLGAANTAGSHSMVFHEEDDSFYVGIGRERSDQLLTISCGSAVTSETRVLDANTPDGEWKVVRPRENEVEYEVSHRGDHLFITLRDEKAPNSRLLVAPLSDPSQTTVLLEHRDDVKLEDVVVGRDWLTVFQRCNGLQSATVYRLPEGIEEYLTNQLSEGQKLEFDEPVYSLEPGGQGDFDSPLLRLNYTSLTTPNTTLDHNLDTSHRVTKKVQPVLGDFDRDDYVTERLWAEAADGTKVPISLVYKKALLKRDGSMPLLLDAYGAYEICNDVYFSSNRLSLLDRGFVFAEAHVRGGGDLGRLWYENGKYLQKRNTFTDFITCAEYLVAESWTSSTKLCIVGRSAGGLTMGAVTNMRPDLFCSVIMGVPFVDVLTTMLDSSIPLTEIEWEEWGNPSNKEYYDYMKSYSPVDNVCSVSTEYPNILATGGLHDPRVGYWEPAKYVAKLRHSKTNKTMLLFHCEMGAGHFSTSGRFDRLKDTAREYAFLLKTTGMMMPRSEAS